MQINNYSILGLVSQSLKMSLRTIIMYKDALIIDRKKPWSGGVLFSFVVHAFNSYFKTNLIT